MSNTQWSRPKCYSVVLLGCWSVFVCSCTGECVVLRPELIVVGSCCTLFVFSVIVGFVERLYGPLFVVLYLYVWNCLLVSYPVRLSSSVVGHGCHAGELGSFRFWCVWCHNPGSCMVFP